MKILLISPPVTKFQRYGSKILSMGSLYPPLGLGVIAAIGEQEGEQIKVIDSPAEGTSFADIREKISKFNPDLVGIQTLVLSANNALKIARLVKNVDKNINVLLGGPNTVNKNNKKLLEKKYIDFVIKGEGELTFKEFLSAFKKDKNFSKIKGLIYKNNGDIIENETREYLKNIDLSPIPAHHYFPMEKYHGPSFLRGKKVLNIISSRGCPYQCAYCNSLVFGKKHRYHSKERVFEEIVILKYEYEADEIHFYDDVFTLNKKRVMELCNYMIKKDLKIPWSCLSRVDSVDRELLTAMKNAGCYQIWFGVESGVERILKHIDKNITIAEVQNAFSLCKSLGIMTHALFMLGLPTETKKDSEETIKLATRLDASFAQFTAATPLPGTNLYELAKKSGKIIETDLSKYNFFGNIVYLPEERTVEDIKATIKKAYKDFYLRWGFAKNTLPYLIKYPFKSWIKFITTAFKQFFNN